MCDSTRIAAHPHEQPGLGGFGKRIGSPSLGIARHENKEGTYSLTRQGAAIMLAASTNGENAMTKPATVASPQALPNEVSAVLTRFNGDAVAALSAALSDLRFLQRELSLASLAMSYGFARGWRPSIERVDEKPEQCQSSDHV